MMLNEHYGFSRELDFRRGCRFLAKGSNDDLNFLINQKSLRMKMMHIYTNIVQMHALFKLFSTVGLVGGGGVQKKGKDVRM